MLKAVRILSKDKYYAFLGLVTVARAQAKTLNELEALIMKTIGLESDDSMHILDAIWGHDHPNVALVRLNIDWEEF